MPEVRLEKLGTILESSTTDTTLPVAVDLPSREVSMKATAPRLVVTRLFPPQLASSDLTLVQLRGGLKRRAPAESPGVAPMRGARISGTAVPWTLIGSGGSPSFGGQGDGRLDPCGFFG